MAAAAVESCSKCGKSPARFWCRDPSDARMAARACSLECAEDREGLQQHCGAAFFDGDYSVALKFRVSLRPNLTHDETDPFATSYLTCDVRAEPALAQTENFGERLWRRRQNSAGTKKTMDFVHEFRVSGRNFSRAALSADTSYCVQCFCQLQNHRDEPCSHRCGFAAFALRGMCEQYAATKKTLFWTTLRDHGPKFSSRGYVSVSLENPEALIKLVRGSENLISPPLADGIGALVGGPKSPGPVDALNAARGYYASITEVFAATAGPTDKGIRVPKLPIYTLSGGATMPSCAFIWFRQPPPIAEDYYANALMIALRRGNPFAAGDAALIEDFCKYSSSGEEWNAKASRLMDAATLISQSFPYLYDYGISADGSELVAADEFSRIGRITMGIDCEDGANETLVFLWGVLTAHHAPGGKWRSRLMAAAQLIRLQYVVTLCLKAVTRPSQSGEDEETTRARRGLAAHASCDMVPLREFARMLGSTTWRRDQPDAAAVAAIIEERKSSLLPESVRLRVVVGETTGYVSSYVAPDSEAPRWARSEVRNIIAGVTKSARSIAQEDMSIDSTFYKYAVSALVHDTLISPGAQAVAKSAGVVWLVPQVSYAELPPAQENVVPAKFSSSPFGMATVWKKIFGGEDPKIPAERLTYGAAHPKYFACAPGVFVLATRPVTRDVSDLVQRLSKFEHPVPPLVAPPPATKFPNYAAVDAVFSKRFAELKKSAPANSEKQRLHTITICIPLHEMSEEKADAIASATARCDSLRSANYFIAAITEHIATLVIQFTFSS